MISVIRLVDLENHFVMIWDIFVVLLKFIGRNCFQNERTSFGCINHSFLVSVVKKID